MTAPPQLESLARPLIDEFMGLVQNVLGTEAVAKLKAAAQGGTSDAIATGRVGGKEHSDGAGGGVTGIADRAAATDVDSSGRVHAVPVGSGGAVDTDGTPLASGMAELVLAMFEAKADGDHQSLDALAELGSDPDGLSEFLADRDAGTQGVMSTRAFAAMARMFAALRTFAWFSDPTPRSKSRATNSDTGKHAYGEAARRLLAAQGRDDRGEPHPETPKAALQRMKAEKEPVREAARAAYQKAVSDPGSVKPEELDALKDHLHSLTRDEVRGELRKMMYATGGKVKAELVDALLEHVRGGQEKAGEGKEQEKTAENAAPTAEVPPAPAAEPEKPTTEAAPPVPEPSKRTALDDSQAIGGDIFKGLDAAHDLVSKADSLSTAASTPEEHATASEAHKEVAKSYRALAELIESDPLRDTSKPSRQAGDFRTKASEYERRSGWHDGKATEPASELGNESAKKEREDAAKLKAATDSLLAQDRKKGLRSKYKGPSGRSEAEEDAKKTLGISATVVPSTPVDTPPKGEEPVEKAADPKSVVRDTINAAVASGEHRGQPVGGVLATRHRVPLKKLREALATAGVTDRKAQDEAILDATHRDPEFKDKHQLKPGQLGDEEEAAHGIRGAGNSSSGAVEVADTPAPVAETVPTTPEKSGSGFGAAGDGHPINGATPDDQRKQLGALIAKNLDGTGADDPMGLEAAGPPASMDKAAPVIREAIDRHTAEKTVGPAMDRLYAEVGEKLGLSKHDFNRALVAMHKAGQVRLSGWSKTLGEIPDPQLAPMLASKVIGYAHPGEKASAPDSAAETPPAAEAAPGEPTVMPPDRAADIYNRAGQPTTKNSEVNALLTAVGKMSDTEAAATAAALGFKDQGPGSKKALIQRIHDRRSAAMRSRTTSLPTSKQGKQDVAEVAAMRDEELLNPADVVVEAAPASAGKESPAATEDVQAAAERVKATPETPSDKPIADRAADALERSKADPFAVSYVELEKLGDELSTLPKDQQREVVEKTLGRKLDAKMNPVNELKAAVHAVRRTAEVQSDYHGAGSEIGQRMLRENEELKAYRQQRDAGKAKKSPPKPIAPVKPAPAKVPTPQAPPSSPKVAKTETALQSLIDRDKNLDGGHVGKSVDESKAQTQAFYADVDKALTDLQSSHTPEEIAELAERVTGKRSRGVKDALQRLRADMTSTTRLHESQKV